MTFIKNQAEALGRYRAVYAGAHRVHAIPLPAERTVVVNDGTILGTAREAVFRRWGRAPPGVISNLKARDPRIVHAHFGTSGPAGMAIAEALGVPLVVTFHGYDATMNEDEARKTLRGRELIRHKRELTERTSVFIAVSDYIRQRLLEKGYPANKILVHYNGIDMSFFNPERDIVREPMIVFVGRFVEKKGARYLIDAARRLRQQGTRFELVMIGSGPLEPVLRKAVAESGITCRFTGFLPAGQVKQWIQRSTVVAIPSVTASDGDSEGLPTVLLEAQAMETPVVATRHSGIPEGLRHDVTGLLVAERDVPALAENLRSLLESPEKARALGVAARRFVAENFGLRSQVDGLESIYDDLCARRDRQTSIAFP